MKKSIISSIILLSMVAIFGVSASSNINKNANVNSDSSSKEKVMVVSKIKTEVTDKVLSEKDTEIKDMQVPVQETKNVNLSIPISTPEPESQKINTFAVEISNQETIDSVAGQEIQENSSTTEPENQEDYTSVVKKENQVVLSHMDEVKEVSGTGVNMDNDVDIKFNHIPTIDEDFKDNHVIITLKHAYSTINKVFTPQDFSKVDIETIEDWTYCLSTRAVDKDKFNQILCLTLKTKSKENVLKAISLLESYENVLAAEPDYNYKVNLD